MEAMAEAELTVVYVTSTVRSPESQATAMFNNERQGKHICTSGNGSSEMLSK